MKRGRRSCARGPPTLPPQSMGAGNGSHTSRPAGASRIACFHANSPAAAPQAVSLGDMAAPTTARTSTLGPEGDSPTHPAPAPAHARNGKVYYKSNRALRQRHDAEIRTAEYRLRSMLGRHPRLTESRSAGIASEDAKGDPATRSDNYWALPNCVGLFGNCVIKSLLAKRARQGAWIRPALTAGSSTNTPCAALTGCPAERLNS
jgi:hypothetical protein